MLFLIGYLSIGLVSLFIARFIVSKEPFEIGYWVLILTVWPLFIFLFIVYVLTEIKL